MTSYLHQISSVLSVEVFPVVQTSGGWEEKEEEVKEDEEDREGEGEDVLPGFDDRTKLKGSEKVKGRGVNNYLVCLKSKIAWT